MTTQLSESADKRKMKLIVILLGLLSGVSAQTGSSTRCLNANTAINSDMDCQIVFTFSAATTLADIATLQDSVGRGCSNASCTRVIQDYISHCGPAVVEGFEDAHNVLCTANANDRSCLTEFDRFLDEIASLTQTCSRAMSNSGTCIDDCREAINSIIVREGCCLATKVLFYNSQQSLIGVSLSEVQAIFSQCNIDFAEACSRNADTGGTGTITRMSFFALLAIGIMALLV